jgi:hypothetical protein
MEKATVYFKKITTSRKAVIFCAEQPTASQVMNSGKQESVNFELGGGTVTARSAFHNFGIQYFCQMDCTKLAKTKEPKVGQAYQLVITNKPVMSQNGEALTNLFWAYAN